MTEAEWLACTDPAPVLGFLRGKASDRKLRLFACACCRHIWQYMPDERGRNAVEVAERLADSMATNAERRAAALAAGAVDLGRGGAASCAVAVSAMHAAERASANAAYIFGSATSTEPYRRRGANNPAYQPAFTRASNKERVAQILLVREVFGNLFHPVVADPVWLAWNGGTVVKLAQAIYSERAFDRLPVLADALEEAGAHNTEILAHCRGLGPHVLGCWCLDLLLGKT
jgi:hypothetical protein